MPVRKIPFVNNEYYHVFNRGVERRPIFLEKRDYLRFYNVSSYYRFSPVPMHFSYFIKLAKEQKRETIVRLQQENNAAVEIHSFVFMPNHFHFLVQQLTDGGVSKFMKEMCNSYARYFNIRHDRIGPLFQGQFKAVRIESDDQLLHISRYIHLNPFTSYVVKTVEDLLDYRWSSLPQYITGKRGFCVTDTILDSFRSRLSYKQFVFDQAEYQRRLENIKHLTFE